MAKKARQKISYVLESAKASTGGHRLGINGLAVDQDKSILYSGGRDGIVCAWDLNLDLSLPLNNDAASHASSDNKTKPSSSLRVQTQAHMGWINDISLAQNNNALVTASADLTVKVWRPHSEEKLDAQPIGAHSDYAMRLATPPADLGANWVASGGLDRKICLWDLNGGGKTLEIDVQGEDIASKGSVYSLAVGHSIVACGGPDKTVRLYDHRSGQKVSKLVGHVNNIRSILIDDAGETILSASVDKTIKMWSIKEGRCIYTFTMHEHPIFSLYSADPRLGVFYSADRSGLIAKTDVRGGVERLDDGLSLAVGQEHSAVFNLVAAGGHIWTATEQSSSINRWADVDTGAMQLPETRRHQRSASAVSSRLVQPPPLSTDSSAKKEIPTKSILRISNTAVFPLTSALEADGTETLQTKLSQVVIEQPDLEVKPIHQVPTETIEGQFGLLKHKLLNDRRRVLTLDTAGDVLMWDLIKCKPIQSFGKQHLEEVEKVVNTREAAAPWCNVDLNSGHLTVTLEPFNCFDAEVYADELQLDESVDFREDQRISLGRWVLRYLFAGLIDEEIKRDEAYRHKLNEDVEQRQAAGRANAPTSIAMPQNNVPGWDPDQFPTPRGNSTQLSPTTPGLHIGLATPYLAPNMPNLPEGSAASPMSPSEKRQSQASRGSIDRDDYFTTTISPADSGQKPVVTPATEAADPKTPVEEKGKEKDKGADSGKAPSTPFGKKFRMSFGTKKLGRSASQTAQEKPVVVADEKTEESESASSNQDKEVEDSFYGVIQKIHQAYDRQLIEAPHQFVETRVTPSLAGETPVLKLPPGTKVIIREEEAGGDATIYQGTVENIGKDAADIEQKAAMWLGHLLLQNQIPFKEAVKVSFVLHPLGDLPAVASADGNNRLNANRMLRVKKILSYVAERIEVCPEQPEPNALKPEEYLELYCNDQLLQPLMSLATLRTHFWKGGNDIVLHYKSNDRKQMRLIERKPEALPSQDASAAPEVSTTTTAPNAP